MPESRCPTTTIHLADDDVTLRPDRRRTLIAHGHGVHVAVDLGGAGSVVIGRAGGCDLRVDHPSVSRRHALVHVGATTSLEDLGSSNGTRLRGARLAPGTRAPFEPGEPVTLGDVQLILLEARPPRAEASGTPPAHRGDLDDTGLSPAMRLVHRLVEQVAPSDLSVLVLGETGSGKEVLAELIHRRSRRAAGPLLRLNCAAMSETLLESELFGHERGAFTGATHAKPGLLETADGGTVFLDELGELPPATQVKLLRVIEERQVRRVGGLVSRRIDVRFLAATNRDLATEIAQGRFRQDLYFRLNGVSLSLPPLRQRRAEILPLAKHFAANAVAGMSGRSMPQLSATAERALLEHHWPGNIRELKNVIERAVVLCRGDRVEAEHLDLTPPCAPAMAMAAEPDIDTHDRTVIQEALARCAGNQTAAARLLGISRRTLTSRLDALALPRPRKRRRSPLPAPARSA